MLRPSRRTFTCAVATFRLVSGQEMKKENASLCWTVILYLTLSTICVTANTLYARGSAAESIKRFPDTVHNKEDNEICEIAYRRCIANINKSFLSTSPVLVRNNPIAVVYGETDCVVLECKGKDVKLTVGGKVYTATQPTYRYAGNLIVYAGNPWYQASKAVIYNLDYNILPAAGGNDCTATSTMTG
ncbi:hypothetical protein EMCRGX_G007899 [Ephydatia muelleri]